MEFNYYIALLFFNSFIYSISFIVIFKRQSYSVIAIRSPILTIINCLCGFVMSNLLICYEFLEEEDELLSHQTFCYYLPFPFIIAHLLFFVSFTFRIHRLLQVCLISSNEKMKAQEFYAKRMTLSEKHYLKYFILILIVLGGVFGLFMMMKVNYIQLPFYFQRCMADFSGMQSVDGFSVYIFFFENLCLVTYAYWVVNHQLKQGPKWEFFIQILLLIFQPNIVRSISNSIEMDYPLHKTAIAFFAINYLFLVSMVHMPFFMSMVDKVKTSYHFTPKLNSNLYLFLSDEICYYSFSDFMKQTETDNFYLAIYTQIMKFKYKYTLEPDYDTMIEDARKLHRSYFEKDNKFISRELMNRVRMTCEEGINRRTITYEMFDEALVFIYYEVLEKIFIEYRNSEDYFQLVDALNLHSYALLKMCNSFSQQAYSL